MPASTRIAAFFAASRFARPVTWHPLDYRDSETSPAIFDEPGEGALGDLVDSTAYTIRYQRAHFVGMRQGEKVEIDGVEYTVRRNPRAEPGSDGAVMVAELSRYELATE